MKKRDRVQVLFDSPSLTQQNFKDECDVNRILSKYGVEQIVAHRSMYNGQYGDFSGVPDYQTALNSVLKANDMFMSLPAHVRARFDNDPGSFLSFVDDEKNRDEMVKLGLIEPQEVPVSLEPVSDG